TSAGTISIGQGVTLNAFSANGNNSNVYMVIGQLPANQNTGTAPDNVAVTAISGGKVDWNNGLIDTSATGSNTINVSTSKVIFDNQGTNSSGISLGGNVTINAGNALTSLDLGDPAVAAFILDLQIAGVVGGTHLTLGPYGATGGTAIITPALLFPTISA